MREVFAGAKPDGNLGSVAWLLHLVGRHRTSRRTMQIRISGAGIAGLVITAIVVAGFARGASADAAAAAPAAAPTLEQRLANLEAYVTNSAPDANGGALAAT